MATRNRQRSRQGTRAARAGVGRALLVGGVALVGLGVHSLVGESAGSARAASVSPPATPLCLGRDDLVVDGATGGNGMTLGGTHTYGSICVRNGGMLLIDHQATLRAGAFYIDDSSSIVADGLPGGRPSMGDCPGSGNGQPDSDPGGTLAIQARTAIIAGSVSARGGAGFDSLADSACPGEDSGKGGKGGAVTIQAATLVLTGRVSARGGAGGNGNNGGIGNGTTGHGGAGGTIAVTAALFRPAIRAASLDVAGGQDGKTGAPAPTGSTRVATLTPSALSALPPAPAPLITVLGRPPARLALQSLGVFGQGMACGPGDLTVPAGTTRTLMGTQTYRHVCVSGLLLAGSGLTLQAQTILVARGGGLSADGAVPAGGPRREATRRRARAGTTVSRPTRVSPAPMAPGATGTSWGARAARRAAP